MGLRPGVVLDNIKDLQEHDRAQRPNFGSDGRDIPKTGVCVIHEVFEIGVGSRCTVKILGNGHPTGITVSGAFCHDAILSIGDVVPYQIKRHDQMILISGSLSETTINNIINEGGGTDIFYPTQYFSIYRGGVKGTFDGS